MPVRKAAMTVVSVLSLSILAALPGWTQTSTGFTVSVRGGVPQPENEFIERGVVGGMVGYRTPRALLFAIDFLYAGKDYYYFEKGRWSEGVEWSQVPAGVSGRSDWIFYRSRNVLSPSVGASLPLGAVGVYATAGVNFSFVVLSDARDAYPGFAAAAERSPASVVPVVRGGLRWPARSLFGFQLEYSWSRDDAVIIFGAVFDSGGSS